MRAALYLALSIFTAVFIIYWIASIRRDPAQLKKPTWRDYAVGFVTQFLDALGIGCFATLSFSYKFWRLVPDEQIPGTMNVGVTLPGIAEAFIYLGVIDVQPVTLGTMIFAAALGAWLGAGVVARWPRRKIQIGMGAALLATAAFALARQFHLLPGGGELLGLAGVKLALAAAVSLTLGALMTLGIGFYAPCMTVVFLLGMNPKAAFPIMMGAAAFVCPSASFQFIKNSRYQLRSALAVTLAGLPGVLLAAYLVKSLPLTVIQWMVICIMIYTSITMLRSAARERALN